MTTTDLYNFEMVQTLYDGTSHYSQTVPLNGINFTFYFDWNSRDEHWYLSVHDSDDNPMSGYTSRKLVANWAVSRHTTDPEKPYGYLFIANNGGDDPALDNLGTDFELLFVVYE